MSLGGDSRLPDGWAPCQIGDIFSMSGGGTPNRGNASFWNGNVAWLSSGDIKSERISHGSEFITQAGLQSSTARLCAAGSVVIVVRSGILRRTLPVAVLDRPAAINQDLRCLDSGDRGLNEWLALALRAHAAEILGANREGTTVESVKADTLRGFQLCVPPPAEQRRIVAKVEALLARAQAARERLARVPLILKRFRQAILAAACNGQLTADWRENHYTRESASDLLSRVIELRKSRWGSFIKTRYKMPVEPDTAASLTCADGWVICSMDQLTVQITSGSRDWTKYYGRGYGTFIMAQNVRPGSLDLSFRQPVDPPEGDRDRERSQVAPGDLLVTIVGANTGDVCSVESELPEHYVCQSVALLRPADARLTPYLNVYLNSPSHGRGEFERYIYGEGRPHLGFEHLRMTAVLLPPLDEQIEIVRRVTALLKVVGAIERRVALATARADKLAQAILAKAFRGELVPTEAELARAEGRDYETAQQLLDRICQNRFSLREKASFRGAKSDKTADTAPDSRPRKKAHRR